LLSCLLAEKGERGEAGAPFLLRPRRRKKKRKDTGVKKGRKVEVSLPLPLRAKREKKKKKEVLIFVGRKKKRSWGKNLNEGKRRKGTAPSHIERRKRRGNSSEKKKRGRYMGKGGEGIKAI